VDSVDTRMVSIFNRLNVTTRQIAGAWG